jgi:hypothetical protein
VTRRSTVGWVLTAMAEHYLDFAVTDLARHQLMDVNIIPGIHLRPLAHAPAVEVYGLLLDDLRSIGITTDQDADIYTYTALIGGLVSSSPSSITDPMAPRKRRANWSVPPFTAVDRGCAADPVPNRGFEQIPYSLHSSTPAHHRSHVHALTPHPQGRKG